MSEPPYEDEYGDQPEYEDEEYGPELDQPILYQDYYAAFEDLVGTTGSAESYSGGSVAGASEWIDMFESTGITTGSREGDVEAFELFLLAFYPQDKSAEDWYFDREEFYDVYDIDEHDIDWEAYREAIDSP